MDKLVNTCLKFQHFWKAYIVATGGTAAWELSSYSLTSAVFIPVSDPIYSTPPSVLPSVCLLTFSLHMFSICSPENSKTTAAYGAYPKPVSINFYHCSKVKVVTARAGRIIIIKFHVLWRKIINFSTFVTRRLTMANVACSWTFNEFISSAQKCSKISIFEVNVDQINTFQSLVPEPILPCMIQWHLMVYVYLSHLTIFYGGYYHENSFGCIYNIGQASSPLKIKQKLN